MRPHRVGLDREGGGLVGTQRRLLGPTGVRPACSKERRNMRYCDTVIVCLWKDPTSKQGVRSSDAAAESAVGEQSIGLQYLDPEGIQVTRSALRSVPVWANICTSKGSPTKLGAAGPLLSSRATLSGWTWS
jgi:hypothetical protein